MGGLVFGYSTDTVPERRVDLRSMYHAKFRGQKRSWKTAIQEKRKHHRDEARRQHQRVPTRAHRGQYGVLAQHSQSHAAPTAYAHPDVHAHQGNGVAVFDVKHGLVILPNGKVIRAGSGKRDENGNPFPETVPNYGPIPLGEYAVAPSCPHTFILKGNRAVTQPGMALTPINGTNTHGRSHLVAHTTHGSGAALRSNGCVVFTQADMEKFQRAGVRRLIVSKDARVPSPTRVAGAEGAHRRQGHRHYARRGMAPT